MKTYHNLYPHVHSFRNLYLAFRGARKAKRHRVAVAGFEFDLEHNLLQLETEMRDQTYKPGPYTNFYVYEPKRRLISAAPFRDRVVHHALCRVICTVSLSKDDFERPRPRIPPSGTQGSSATLQWSGKDYESLALHPPMRRWLLLHRLD